VTNKTLVEIKNVAKQLNEPVGVDELSPDIEKALFGSFSFYPAVRKNIKSQSLSLVATPHLIDDRRRSFLR